jgi:cysteine desulfurase
MDEHIRHIQGIKQYMIEKLNENIPGIQYNGDYNGQCLYTVLNVSFPPHAGNDMLLFNLDLNGVAASGGSACSSGSEKGSHVLAALNVPADRANVRFSFSKFTQKEDIDYAIEKLCEIFELKKMTA